MSNERNPLKAGIFIVVCILLVIAIIVAIKGIGALTQPVTVRSVSFSLTDDVGGLRVGDDLRIGGFKVGEVRSIDVQGADGSQPPRILVTFSIPKRFVVREGARIGVQGTLTGTSWLNFDNLGAGAALPRETTLAGQPSPYNQLFAAAPTIQQLITDVKDKTLPAVNTTITKFGQTADSFKTTGDKTTELAAHLRQQIDPMIDRYNKVADPAAAMTAHLRDMFGDVKGDWRQLVANVAKISNTFKEKLPGLLDQVDKGLASANTTIDGINGSLADIQSSIANVRDISESARSVITGNRTKLNEMVGSLKTTGDNLKAASSEIRRSPWRLLYKPRPGEVENLNIFDSAREFAEGANDLNDAASALRDAMKDPKVDQAQIQKLMQHVDDSFAKFQQVEQKLWKSVRD